MSFRKRETISLRDPLHGAIEFEKKELKLIQHPALQRLLRIKQLGFAELSYPGASHSRFLHSIGAMLVATKMWESIQSYLDLPRSERRRFRSLLRAAALLHDIGHPPFSHSAEIIMPKLSQLDLTEWLPSREDRTATHEDYTLKIILQTSLSSLLEELEVEPELLAHLLSGSPPNDASPFSAKGLNFYPLLRQIIASELDADRMDYLRRDALFTGVAYGHFDLDWLIRNLRPIEQNSAVYLGLDKKAIYTFEDFLLSRYQMFNSVYYHTTSICYREMLRLYYRESRGEYTLPTDAEKYLETDDIQLFSVLRRSNNQWARRIVEHNPYLKLIEIVYPDQPTPSELQIFQPLLEEFKKKKIPHFHTISLWTISPYTEGKTGREPPLFVIDSTFEQIEPLSSYAQLYRRYPELNRIFRLYVAPEKSQSAEKLLKKYTRQLKPLLTKDFHPFKDNRKSSPH